MKFRLVREILLRAIAQVDVAGAIGHEHDEIVAKWIFCVSEIEDALLCGWIKLLQIWPVKAQLWIARGIGPTGTASLKVDK